MGEIRDDDEDLTAAWRAMLEFAESDEQFHDLAARLREGESPPSGPWPLLNTPLIVDTDVGGDPDDAIALAVTGLRVPQLRLVITTDECGGERARFGRYLLDLTGRQEVPVVTGADLGNTRYFCVDGLVPQDIPEQPADVLAAVDAVMDSTDGQVRWVGMGPMSNLAAILAARPSYADRLVVTQMGGALNYRDPARAEHNVRLDPAAASAVLHTAQNLRMVISDVSFTPRIEITPDSPLGHALADPAAPPWRRLLAAHLERWYSGFHRGSMQHDALTLAAALAVPVIDFELVPVIMADDGRMRREPDGISVRLATRADYDGFMWWLTTRLDLASAAATPAREQ
jgi:pyrimidine-specific ribonucleoside hydrolase